MDRIKKIAFLAPARYRPKFLIRALESWALHSVASDLFFAFQNDDRHLDEYIKIAGERPYIICDNIGMAAKVNALCELAQSFGDYDAYMVLNDDFIIRTPEWDKKLLYKLDVMERASGHRMWILHWKDGIQNEKLPQSFCTRELLKVIKHYNPAVGYMRHLFVDNVYKHIGTQCGILHYCDDVFLEHRHVTVCNDLEAMGYKPSDKEYNHHGEKAKYELWLRNEGKNLVHRIQLELRKYDT